MYTHPEWLKKACFYEIYPQSFLDTNGDGIGDLAGIIKKLDYIKSLGFNALWINPIFESPFYDAGYDVTDFYKVAKRYGTNELCYTLFSECHKRGIKVLLDLVPGHTSIESKWFKESCDNDHNEFSDRYIWTKSVWDATEDIPCIRGFTKRSGSVATNFFSIQPALNYGFGEVKNPNYEEKITDKGPQKTIQSMIDVILFWLGKGCDGFRCDMAGWLVKRDAFCADTIKVWQQIFSSVKEKYPESAFVSEWNDPEKSLLAGFNMDFLLQDGYTKYNNAMTRSDKPYFRFTEKDSNALTFLDHFEIVQSFGKERQDYVSMISGNHDTDRIKKWLTDEELKFYYTFMYTIPNVPFMYYGDEIGMNYLDNLESVEGGYQRTGTRTPMQWNSASKAGFTKANSSYIKVNPDYRKINVEKQENNDSSLLSFVKKLLSCKNTETALDNDASFKLLPLKRKDSALAYIREKEGQKVLVVINPRLEEETFENIAVSNDVLLQIGSFKIDSGKLVISPKSLVILKL